ncbi:hypothetical protein GYH30_034157 [Glycine max]|nr:hypothetical protein GYH30_034157 [Glycine max]
MANVVLNPTPATFRAEEDQSMHEAWPWLHKNRHSSYENYLAFTAALALNSCNNYWNPLTSSCDAWLQRKEDLELRKP